jgi:integrase
MKKECSIISANKYLYISYHCSDGRLRYPSGIKGNPTGDPLPSKVQNIKNLVNSYITKHELIGEKVKKQALQDYLDGKLAPGKKKRSGRDLIKDHQAMIAQMRSGKLLKKRTKSRYSDFSIAQYERMRERWEDCANDPASGFVLSYDMDIDMFRKLPVWMVKKKYSANTMYNIVNNLRIFLKYTYDEGYHTNKVYQHRDFSVPQEDSDAIAPTYEEIIRLYNYSCSTPTHEKARDFFVYGCFLALRVRDLARINDYHLIGNVYEVVTGKTGKKVTIPCHWIAREIYDKYKGIIPVYPRQTLARILPIVCEGAGITELKLIAWTEGGERKQEYFKRCDLITPHSMRRFFATWMYRDLRRQPREIMPITGHESEESFFKYIKIEMEINAQDIANDIAFKKPV